jgi:hypothetical protein
MKWKHPPIAKIYEAFGAVADGRVHVSGNSAEVLSSSGNKFYTVTFDPISRAIMANDNASFYKGYLGYPAIAFLMLIGEIKYSTVVSTKLKGIAWKDINQMFKNDFEKTIAFILKEKTLEDQIKIIEEVGKVDEQLLAKNYSLLGAKRRPPEGY